MKWISVEDRLPEPMTMVLVVDKTFAVTDEYNMSRGYDTKRPAGVRFGYVCDVGFRVEGTNGYCQITYWMPLPEPPQQENK